ncbi:hypothetical protein CPSG_09263 [Coccidioides posadasii str. Silveira]|uniref:Uncharacterized protein n=1 Tax=Coccidioides posadasii (strain RMSCC 757 / Silveira) TaxID=443226 RepID=E9DHG4_COCPS|nr:hypothetical protein CPSG_09263 [Coccidioides posadasii str. Silveira]
MQRRRATTHTHTQRDEERERKRRRRRERAKADGEERKAKKEEKKAAMAESVSQYADNTAQRRRGDLIRGGKQAVGGAWRPGGARWAGVGQSQPAAWAGDAGRDESFHAGCGPVIRLRYSCVLPALLLLLLVALPSLPAALSEARPLDPNDSRWLSNRCLAFSKHLHRWPTPEDYGARSVDKTPAFGKWQIKRLDAAGTHLQFVPLDAETFDPKLSRNNGGLNQQRSGSSLSLDWRC